MEASRRPRLSEAAVVWWRQGSGAGVAALHSSVQQWCNCAGGLGVGGAAGAAAVEGWRLCCARPRASEVAVARLHHRQQLAAVWRQQGRQLAAPGSRAQQLAAQGIAGQDQVLAVIDTGRGPRPPSCSEAAALWQQGRAGSRELRRCTPLQGYSSSLQGWRAGCSWQAFGLVGAGMQPGMCSRR